MKKIILLLVSGLLIACMAGSAMAQNAYLTDIGGNAFASNPYHVTTGEPTTMGIHIYNIAANENGHTYPITIVLEKDDGAGGFVAAPLDEATYEIIPGHDTITFPLSPATTTTDSNVVKVTLMDRADPLKQYKVTIKVGTYSGSELVSASENLSIPEFPTVALPVAAILGLVFVFGRKKDGL